MLADLGQALRLLRRRPAFSAAAVTSLSVGFGAAIAVCALVDAVLVRALPFRDPDRLVWMYNARTERDRAPFSIPDLEDYARGNTTLESMAQFTNWTANLTGAGEPERLEGTRVSGEFFRVIGASPLIGRALDAGDAGADAHVVVLTHKLWSRRFASARSIEGQSILLNGTAFQVVGVMPPGFVFPFRDAEVAVPLSLAADPRRGDRGANFLRVVARLNTGVSIATAKADLDRMADRLRRTYPDDDARKIGVNLYPLHAEIVIDYRQILWSLFAAVGALVAVGCGNLANLVLARNTGRVSELALRVSLGASRLRIARQLGWEVGVIVAVSAVVGLGIAAAAIGLWRAFGPAAFPRMEIVAIDGRVLAFVAGLSVVATAICVMPALLVARNISGTMADGARTATYGRRQAIARRTFVVLQVAGCALLLVCTGINARAFARLESVPPGFTADRTLTMQLALPPLRYATLESVIDFHDALAARLDALPGTIAAGAVSLLPLSGLLNTMDITFPDRPAPPPDAVPQAHFRIAGPGYFEAAGISILDGRSFSVHDTANHEPVVVISRALAERHWPGEQAVGKLVRLGLDDRQPPLKVVGIVSDVKQFALDGAPTADLYIPVRQMPASQRAALVARMNWVIRTRDTSSQLGVIVRQAVHELDPEIATSSTRSLEEIRSASLASRRINVRLLEIFGQIALALAAIGLYAVAALSSAARRRELAIRTALGARPSGLVTLLLQQELPAIVVGVAAGLAGGAAVNRFVAAATADVGSSDAATYAVVAVGLTLIGALATWMPVRRASHADPLELLRM